VRLGVILWFDVESPEDVPLVLDAIDPPELPGFAGTCDLTIGPSSDALRAWLDEDEEPKP